MYPDIILLDGPVGSGKGTQAHLISEKFNYYQFGFGTELRDFVATYIQNPENINYERALKIRQIMQAGENVSPEDLFFTAGSKIQELIEQGKKIVIDSAKNLEAFEWLASIAKEQNLTGVLIHLDLNLDFSLERLSHRYYAPNIKDFPFSSYQEALEHCLPDQLPIRRQDDLNQDRIYRQYELYQTNKPLIKDIMILRGGFDYLELSAFEPINDVFDKILEYLEQTK